VRQWDKINEFLFSHYLFLLYLELNPEDRTEQFQPHYMAGMEGLNQRQVSGQDLHLEKEKGPKT
jgi:hypothetical protein